MSIPAHARGKAREPRVQKPLDEIQVDVHSEYVESETKQQMHA